MKTRVFVIDDEPDYTHMLRRSLELQGYFEVGEENNATAAVSAARAFGPDLILLDVMMPDLDGTDLAEQIRADRQLRDVPVLFLTALVTGSDATRGGACKSGGNTFLPKTIPPGRLIRCIEDAVRRAKEARQKQGQPAATGWK
jgi:DNA-binding response OmpR family regulator